MSAGEPLGSTARGPKLRSPALLRQLPVLASCGWLALGAPVQLVWPEGGFPVVANDQNVAVWRLRESNPRRAPAAPSSRDSPSARLPVSPDCGLPLFAMAEPAILAVGRSEALQLRGTPADDDPSSYLSDGQLPCDPPRSGTLLRHRAPRGDPIVAAAVLDSLLSPRAVLAIVFTSIARATLRLLRRPGLERWRW